MKLDLVNSNQQAEKKEEEKHYFSGNFVEDVIAVKLSYVHAHSAKCVSVFGNPYTFLKHV